MVFPHYWTLWDKIPHYWTLFIVDADAIVVCYPLHDDGRQSFARPHAHSAKLVLVTTKITVKRLSVNPSPIGQFLSCHRLHFSLFTFHFSLFIFIYSSYDTAPCLRSAISRSSRALSSSRLAATAIACFSVALPLARSSRRAAASSMA